MLTPPPLPVFEQPLGGVAPDPKQQTVVLPAPPHFPEQHLVLVALGVPLQAGVGISPSVEAAGPRCTGRQAACTTCLVGPAGHAGQAVRAAGRVAGGGHAGGAGQQLLAAAQAVALQTQAPLWHTCPVPQVTQARPFVPRQAVLVPPVSQTDATDDIPAKGKEMMASLQQPPAAAQLVASQTQSQATGSNTSPVPVHSARQTPLGEVSKPSLQTQSQVAGSKTSPVPVQLARQVPSVQVWKPYRTHTHRFRR